ncbi:aspartic proteinase-like protein 2 [Tanacetum coccineum]
MNMNKRGKFSVIGFVFIVVVKLCDLVSGNVVFHVQHKFAYNKRSLNVLKSHDAIRHRRFLSASVEVPLGGDGSPTSAALYFTKIQIGSPPKDYHVQVDTGSDLLWVNCIECDKCPTKSDLGVPLALYDPKGSSSAKTVGCNDGFCKSTFDAPGKSDNCKVGMLCAYAVTYGDGSSTAGFFVNDIVRLAQVSGNRQTTSMWGNVTFGCGAKQSGELGSSEQALDGIVGFGQSKTSMLSQLASEKKVKKMFSHCLDGNKGGGIFAIGEVVEPKVNTTPILDDHTHYNIELKSIDVNGDDLKLPTSLFDFLKKKGAVVDSGTTLAYFPDEVYNQLMEKIMAAQPDKKPFVVEKVFKCYKYSGNIDDGFPVVTFHFENSLALKVLPHQYFFQVEDDEWCIGFQNSNLQSDAGGDLTLLGDLVLSDRLVTYDMENQAIGWTDYDCSSSIKVKDEESGNVYEVGAQDISSSHHTCNSRMILGLLLFLVAILIT